VCSSDLENFFANQEKNAPLCARKAKIFDEA
jgi:hypothetical protein